MSLDNLFVDIKRRTEALERSRQKYLKAKKLLGELSVSDAVSLLFTYKAGDPPEKAVFILAQCQSKLESYRQLKSTVDRFEHNERSLAELRAKLPVEKSLS